VGLKLRSPIVEIAHILPSAFIANRQVVVLLSETLCQECPAVARQIAIGDAAVCRSAAHYPHHDRSPRIRTWKLRPVRLSYCIPPQLTDEHSAFTPMTGVPSALFSRPVHSDRPSLSWGIRGFSHTRMVYLSDLSGQLLFCHVRLWGAMVYDACPRSPTLPTAFNAITLRVSGL
jgi:hypothetical protein